MSYVIAMDEELSCDDIACVLRKATELYVLDTSDNIPDCVLTMNGNPVAYMTVAPFKYDERADFIELL